MCLNYVKKCKIGVPFVRNFNIEVVKGAKFLQ